MDTNKPVSRQEELKLHKSFGWLPYWENAASGAIPETIPVAPAEEEVPEPEDHTTNHLQSTKEVFGYKAQAKNGEIGEMADFIMEDDWWQVRYAVVDTGNWLHRRKVLLSCDWIEEISWANQKVYMDLSRETIKNSPEFEPSVPVNREYELRLYDHYGRPTYWS